MFENRVLRIKSGPRRDELTGGWIKLYNKELHNLHFPPTIIRMVMACTTNRNEECI
jgi:hypothetical protein